MPMAILAETAHGRLTRHLQRQRLHVLLHRQQRPHPAVCRVVAVSEAVVQAAVAVAAAVAADASAEDGKNGFAGTSPNRKELFKSYEL